MVFILCTFSAILDLPLTLPIEACFKQANNSKLSFHRSRGSQFFLNHPTYNREKKMDVARTELQPPAAQASHISITPLALGHPMHFTVSERQRSYGHTRVPMLYNFSKSGFEIYQSHKAPNNKIQLLNLDKFAQ